MGIVKVAICGDAHLSARSRGNHVNYPKATLEYFEAQTKILEDKKVDYIIDAGDFAYGNFTLRYRAKVEDMLLRRRGVTNGKMVAVRGNHDISSGDMSEWEYYTKVRKWFNNEQFVTLTECTHGYKYFNVGKTRFHLMDYDCDKNTLLSVDKENGIRNILVTHKFVKYTDSDMPPYGEPILLDNKSIWYDLDLIVCGHIHNIHLFAGNIAKGGMSKRVPVYYPGSMCPTDRGGIRDKGEIMILSLDEDTADMQVERVEYDLWKPEESYTGIEEIEIEKKVEIADVIKELNDRERNNCDPIVAIENMSDYPKVYRDKAIQLLLAES